MSAQKQTIQTETGTLDRNWTTEYAKTEGPKEYD